MTIRSSGRIAILAAMLLSAAATAGAQTAATPSARAGNLAQWQPLIAEAAQRFAIPAAWIRAVMLAESGGRTTLDGRPITSRAGAMGLMQVMPDTYDAMRRAHHLGPDPYDPHDNILAGAAFLRAMFDRYGYPGLFAAYNAGPGRYDAYLSGEAPLPAETRSYIAGLNQAPPAPELPATILTGTRLFFPLHTFAEAPRDASPASAPTALTPSANGLFVPLTTPAEHRP